MVLKQINKTIYYKAKQFYQDERGVYAMIMALITIFLVITVAFVLETSHMFTQKARLSDGLEQAALAVTTENNQFRSKNALTGSVLEDTNDNLVNSYVRSYIPNSQDLDFKTYCYKKSSAGDTVACGVEGRYKQNSIFPLNVSNEKPQTNKGEIIPQQVTVGSSAYAERMIGKVYTPQDIIVALNISGLGDMAWYDDGDIHQGDGSPFCTQSSLVNDTRDRYIRRYKQHCVNYDVAARMGPHYNKLLPFSRMAFMDRILFAQKPEDWEPMKHYDKNTPENQYLGLIQRLFKKDSFGQNTQTGRDRVRFILSDFAYPNPQDPQNTCVFPFQMKEKELSGKGFYDWIYADPKFSYNYFLFGHHYAYNISSFTGEEEFKNILNTSLSELTYYPLAFPRFGGRGFSKYTYQALVTASLLHQYLDTEGTANSMLSLTDDTPHQYLATFRNQSDIRPYNYALTCFAGMGDNRDFDSNWVSVSNAANESNTEGLNKVRKVFAGARPGGFSFLPTALMQAAERSLLGGDQDKNHRKVIILIAGTTQHMPEWTACFEGGNGNQRGRSFDQCTDISAPVELNPSYLDPNTDEYKWWSRSQDVPQSIIRNDQHVQTPIRHILKYYSYCNVDYSSSTAYYALRQSNQYDCTDRGVYDGQFGLIRGKWWDYKSTPVAVPNPVVSVVSEQERDTLPDRYREGSRDSDDLFKAQNNSKFIDAVFQRIQYELLVKYDMCGKLRRHLKQVTNVDPLIALIFINQQQETGDGGKAEAYWEKCVDVGPDPLHPGQTRPMLFHVGKPSDFKRVMSLLLQPQEVQSTGVLNINADRFKDIKNSIGN